MYHRILVLYELLIVFTHFAEELYLLSKYAEGSIDRVAAVGLQRMYGYFPQFLVLF